MTDQTTNDETADALRVEQAKARLLKEIRRNREEANMDDRAAASTKNPDAAPFFAAWALAKRERADDIETLLAALSDRATDREGEALLDDDIPEYEGCDISHLEGLASYLDNYARDKGRERLPESKKLFEMIAKRLRQFENLRNKAVFAPARQPIADPAGERWLERWYGSEPEKGSAIVTERRDLIAYLGGDQATHAAATAIASAHNATLATLTARLAQAEAERDDLREALRGIDDDYMTSEAHHPGYVLIPAAKFEQLRSTPERWAGGEKS